MYRYNKKTFPWRPKSVIWAMRRVARVWNALILSQVEATGARTLQEGFQVPPLSLPQFSCPNHRPPDNPARARPLHTNVRVFLGLSIFWGHVPLGFYAGRQVTRRRVQRN